MSVLMDAFKLITYQTKNLLGVHIKCQVNYNIHKTFLKLFVIHIHVANSYNTGLSSLPDLYIHMKPEGHGCTYQVSISTCTENDIKLLRCTSLTG